MDEVHEIYPGAPVALVAVEIIFPSEVIAGPVPPAVGRALGELLGDDWVAEQIPPPTFNVPGVQTGMPLPPGWQGLPIIRFADRDRGASVALSSGRVTMQTTRQKGRAMPSNEALEPPAALVGASRLPRGGHPPRLFVIP